MPEYRVLVPPTADKELVPLDELNAALRLDLDPVLVAAYLADPLAEAADPALIGQIKYVERLGRAARKKVEAYIGRYLAPQTVRISYTLEEPYELPVGATAVSVSGYFDTLEALAARGTWLVEYQKGISINRQLPLEAAFAQTYTVVAEVVADVEYSDLAATAITELVGEWYKNRETTGEGRFGELPVSWRVKLAEARVTVLGFGN
jgi:hypothetical protein